MNDRCPFDLVAREGLLMRNFWVRQTELGCTDLKLIVSAVAKKW